MSITKTLKQIFLDFIINSFWKSWLVLVFLGIILGLNFFLWQAFISTIKENPNPFILVSGLGLLNIILANYLWNKEKLASYFLLIIILAISIFMLAFVKYLVIVI